jgi:hypothetical protein
VPEDDRPLDYDPGGITQTDPSSLYALIGAAAGAAVTLLVAFGIDVSHAQAAAILGFVSTLLPLLTALGIRRHAYAPATVRTETRKAATLANAVGYRKGVQIGRLESARADSDGSAVSWHALEQILRDLRADLAAGALAASPTDEEEGERMLDAAREWPDLFDEDSGFRSRPPDPDPESSPAPPGELAPIVDEVGPLVAAVEPGTPEADAEAARMDAVVERLSVEADRVAPLTDDELDALAAIDTAGP